MLVLLFSSEKNGVIFWTKKISFGYILGDIFTNPSGHTALQEMSLAVLDFYGLR
jgi:hypothetical protein